MIKLSRKTAVIAGGALAVLAIGAGLYGWWGARGSAPEYRLAKVERGPILAAVSATGTVNPVVSVQVGSQVSGQIKEIYVDFNSPVKKGQVIARIDPDTFALRVNQAMADLESARATVLTQRANVAALKAEVSRARVTLADAERDYGRNKVLHEKNFVSGAVLDKTRFLYEAAGEQVKTAQAQVAVGEAQIRNVEALVKQREAQLEQAKVDLNRTAIRAPVDGIVISRAVDAGQTVAASLQAPTLFVIAQNLTDMQVETSIDEAEIGRLRVGQEASFTVDSFPGRTFTGKVSQVRKAAQVVQNVVTYIAVIATSNTDLSLVPGMTANVRIVIDRRENVLKIPNTALRYRPARPASAAAGKASAPAGRGQAGKAARERLAKDLKLDESQRLTLETIYRETGQKIRAVSAEMPEDQQRQVAKLRAERRSRIAAMLNDEQRARYEEIVAESRNLTRGRVWSLDEDGEPKAVSVRLGLTDGTYTELVGGVLKEGMQLIIGAAAAGTARGKRGGSSPRFF
ncbi:MAG: efflux RND transporter periplasmic adaptor subunit [Betaproteobacteria bacterium]|nr:efflux RND transporter periplasmic adaptor subunit [Betaproteobacteria bacterium]MDH3438038.1 efflux RND transporter periplasmic adaptor subunit [Betaproteobacteria bacterium]